MYEVHKLWAIMKEDIGMYLCNWELSFTHFALHAKHFVDKQEAQDYLKKLSEKICKEKNNRNDYSFKQKNIQSIVESQYIILPIEINAKFDCGVDKPPSFDNAAKSNETKCDFCLKDKKNTIFVENTAFDKYQRTCCRRCFYDLDYEIWNIVIGE